MTLTPVQETMPVPPPRRRLVAGLSIGLLLAAGGVVVGFTHYYDSVPLLESSISYPVVRVSELAPPVAGAFVAAVDPDFYTADDSLITRRYTTITSGAGDESWLRTRIMARKAEASYTKEEILDGYLNRAGYGRGAVGLVAAAQTYFQKPATQLTVAEAVLLAVPLHPDRPDPKAGREQVLDIMVERGWLTPAERDGLVFPG